MDLPDVYPGGFVINPNYTAIGFEHIIDTITIGFDAHADSHGIAIGQHSRAGKRAAAFGNNIVAPDGRLVILGWDLTDIGPRLEALEQTVAAQQKVIAKQQEMIQALWYFPGMPGAEEAKKSYFINRDQLTE